MPPLRLITIAPSHYCEKARWALDHAGLPFTEEAHIPLVHAFHTMRSTRRQSRTVPILVTPDELLTESTDIVRFADRHVDAARRLYPDDQRPAVDELVASFDRTIGPLTRRLAYCHVLDHPQLFVSLMAAGVSPAERSVLRVAHPLQRRLLRRLFRISDRVRRELPGRLDEALAPAAQLLADGRPYLTGDRFTAADLTLVALLQPVLLLREPDLARLPADIAGLVARYRATPVGAWAARVWGEHRHPGSLEER